MTTSPARDDDAGFTLIEILVATVITSIILVTLVASFLIFVNNISYTSGRDDHAAGAEVLSSYLDNDLASATDYSPKTFPTLTTCPAGSAAQAIVTLTWTEYVTPAATAGPDADPIAGGSSFQYSAAYTLQHDDSAATTSSACMIQRKYTAGGTVVSTNVLIRSLSNIGIQNPSTTLSSCGSGTPLVVTLNQYQTSATQTDTSPSYRYDGCLKARTNGVP